MLTTSLALPSVAVGEDTDRHSLTPKRDVAGIGFDFGDSGFWLAAYAHINAEFPEDAADEGDQVSLDDLTLILRYEPSPRLAFFAEADFEDTIGWEQGERVSTDGAVANLERLYLDYTVTPEVTVRAGKFLTPFGIWNQVRRAPLTWTVERPVITETAFPPHVTGLGATYKTTHESWTADATIFGQAQDELAAGDTEITASGAIGGRASVGREHALGFATVGASTVSFENHKTNRWENVFGVDLDLSIGRNELTSEFIYANLREDDADRELGLYVQDAFPIYGSIYGVLRYEHLDLREEPAANGFLAGLAWRPSHRFVTKVNYQFVDDANDELLRGLFLSVAFFL